MQKHSHRYGSSRIGLDVPSNQATIRQRYTLHLFSNQIFTYKPLNTLSNKFRTSGTHAICGLVFAVLLIGAVTANAAPVQSTTTAYVSFRDCISGTTVCDSISPSRSVSVDGLPGSPQAKAHLQEPAYGVAIGGAELTGKPGAMKATAEVTSLPTRRNGSTTGTLQVYTNVSERLQTLTVEGVLTYDQTVPDENADFPVDGGGTSGANADVELFTMNTTTIELGTTARDNFQTLSGEPPPDSNYKMIKRAGTNGMVSPLTDKGTRLLTLSTELKPGDSIWLFAGLQAISANGAKVTASLETSLKIETE